MPRAKQPARRLSRRRAFFLAMTVPGLVFSFFGALQALSMFSLQRDMNQTARATAIRLAQGSLTRQGAQAFVTDALAPWNTSFQVELVFPGERHGFDRGKPSPGFEVGIAAPLSALSGFGLMSLLSEGKVQSRAFLTPRRSGS